MSEDTAVRSRIMRSVRRTDTGPELTVRSFLHRRGFRFSLHRRQLPGSPDIVLRRYRTAIFVHGCFWHRHFGCARATTPKARADFWKNKFETNVARDRRNREDLERLGYHVITV